MKALNYSCKILGIILALFMIMSSCSSAKKTALSCPDLPGNPKNHQITFNHTRNNHKLLVFSQRDNKERNSFSKNSKFAHRDHKRNSVTKNRSNQQSETTGLDNFNGFSNLSKIEFKNNLVASNDNSIIPVVKTFSDWDTENDMKIDDPLDRLIASALIPVNSNSTSIVSLINYTEGEQVTVTEKNIVQQENPPKIHGLAIAGLVAGVVGLFVAGIPLGILATIFGMVALSKIKKFPGKFSGKGLAIASIILGFAAIIGAIIVLAIV